MFDPVVEILINENENFRPYHEKNKCSSCKHACWTTTIHGYPNSGTMHDYMRFLMNDAMDTGKAKGRYRCRCLVQHEYMDFSWFDEDEEPNIVDNCGKFEEYEPNDEDEPKRPEGPRAGKRERMVPVAKDAAGAEPNPLE